MKKDKCYLIIHGIETDRLESENHYRKFKIYLNSIGDTSDIFDGSWGYFPVLWNVFNACEFIIRPYIIWQLRLRIEDLCKEYEKVIIIAHSYGTFLSIKALEQSNNVSGIYLGFFGSILHCKYDFRILYNKVKAVFNFCSTKDQVVFFSILLGKGQAGYWGFRHRGFYTADTTMKFEPVWLPIAGADDKFPYVINCHFNEASHYDWIKRQIYIEYFLTKLKEFCTYHEK